MIEKYTHLKMTYDVLNTPRENLSGFRFNDAREAFNASMDIVNKKGATRILISDIDDALVNSEPVLRGALNRYMHNVLPHTFIKDVNMQDLLEFRRYFQIPAFIQAMYRISDLIALRKQAGNDTKRIPDLDREVDGEDYMKKADGNPADFKFAQFFKTVGNSRVLHAQMETTTDRKELIKTFVKNGFVVGAYATARPFLLADVTAASLQYHNFPVAPILDVNANAQKPATAKVEYFEQMLARLEDSDSKEIVFYDDDVDTAIAVKNKFKGKIICIVPIVERNQNRREDLIANNIIHGTSIELAQTVRQLFPNI